MWRQKSLFSNTTNEQNIFWITIKSHNQFPFSYEKFLNEKCSRMFDVPFIVFWNCSFSSPSLMTVAVPALCPLIKFLIFPVDLLALNVAIEAFDAHGLRGQNERTLDVTDMVTILGSLYETVSVTFPSFNFHTAMCWEDPPLSLMSACIRCKYPRLFRRQLYG